MSPTKIGQTDRDAAWDNDSCGTKEPYIKCTGRYAVVPPGEHVMLRSNVGRYHYCSHLLLLQLLLLLALCDNDSHPSSNKLLQKSQMFAFMNLP